MVLHKFEIAFLKQKIMYFEATIGNKLHHFEFFYAFAIVYTYYTEKKNSTSYWNIIMYKCFPYSSQHQILDPFTATFQDF